MDAETVRVLVAVIAGACTVGGAWVAARATQRSKETEATADRAASFIEGYDEFVSHLRGRVSELERHVDDAYAKLRDTEASAREAERRAHEAERQADRTQRLMERALAECAVCTEQLERLRAALDELERGADG